MQSARIADLLEPFLNPCHSESGRRTGEEPAFLSSAQLQGISTYIDLLLRWNARINLTGIRNEEEIVTRHFGESLFAARHLFPLSPVTSSGVKDFDLDSASDQRPAPYDLVEAQSPKPEASLADLGSGSGFPGIPIKLWAPNVALTLIESNHKKAAFLRELTRTLTLTDINIQNVRAETLPAAAFDVVTLRAVERFINILPTAADLLAPSGRLALLIASPQLEQAQSTLPNLTWRTVIPVPESRSRILVIAAKHHASK
jgi:16S rRNA (guanine527-N7)-methyltransferase